MSVACRSVRLRRAAQTEGLHRDNLAIENAARRRNAVGPTRGHARCRSWAASGRVRRRAERHGVVHPGTGLVGALLGHCRPLDAWVVSATPRARALRGALVVSSQRREPYTRSHRTLSRSQQPIATMSVIHRRGGSALRNFPHVVTADRAPLAIQTIVMSDCRCVGPVSLPLEAAPARRTSPLAGAVTRPQNHGCKSAARGSCR